MNVAGYEDVLAAAELVEFAPGLVQKIVSIAGLSILDMRRVASENTLDVPKQTIESEFDRLSTDMIKPLRHVENVEERVTSRLRLLQGAPV